MLKIPRCMSTQHPDNVAPPIFSKSGSVLDRDDEVTEVYYGFSHFGCDEQMWDVEAKEADYLVVRKLFENHPEYFKQHVLGDDVRLTVRVPNPEKEKDEAMLLAELLTSIPRSYATAKKFYGNGKNVPPIFEIIMPMTESTADIDRPFKFYKKFVYEMQNQPVREGDISVGQWLGEVNPESISVIPLFEQQTSILNAHSIVAEYLKDKKVPYQRVFLARSDPAMHYGMITAVLLNKIALQRLDGLSHNLGIPICPIIGVGGAPFRGNLLPNNVERVIAEYPSAHTFTVQSAFKYDSPVDKVIGAIDKLKHREIKPPQQVDEKRCLNIIEKSSAEHYQQMIPLDKLIDLASKHVPKRRMRKMHTGMWKADREVGKIKLPRVITFTAGLYSIGIPPELLGLSTLNNEDLKFLRETYLNFDHDIKEAARFFNPPKGVLPGNIETRIRELTEGFADTDASKEHRELSAHIAKALKRGNTTGIEDLITRAANYRGFLG